MPRSLLHPLIILAAIILIYRPSLDHGFVWDDQLYVVQNPAVQSWSHAADAFTSPATTWSSNPQYNISEWRPLRNISYLIDHTLYGLNPTGWHLTNILLHALAAILLYFLILRLIRLTPPQYDGHSCPSPPAQHHETTEHEHEHEHEAGQHKSSNFQRSTFYFLLRSSKLCLQERSALAAALFWALHPVQTEVVAWIKSRDDLLSAIFYFATLLVALPRPQSATTDPAVEGSRGHSCPTADTPHQNPGTTTSTSTKSSKSLRSTFHVLLSTSLFLCALLSKENTIILAALYPIILLLISPRPPRSLHLRVKHFLSPNHRREATPPFIIHNSKFIIPTTAFILIALTYLATHHLLLGRTSQGAPLAPNPGAMLLTMLHALTRYLQLILWPWPPTLQSADYDNYPIITNPLNPRALVGLISLLIMLFFLCFSFVSSRLRVKVLLPSGIALFLLALLPYANIIPMMQILAERFLYLPLAGIAILLSSLLIFFASSRLRVSHLPFPNHRRAATPQFIIHNSSFIIATLIIASLAFQTHSRLPVWQSELTLFRANLHANPTSWRPADLHIKALLRSQQTTAALTHARRALRQFPRDPDIVRTAALTHLLAGHETTGTQLTQYAIQLQPNDPRATTTLQRWKQMQNQNPTP